MTDPNTSFKTPAVLDKSAPFVVLKFGGTSVATAARWQTIADVTAACMNAGERPIVVCSALAGVSNMLEALLDAALRGEQADPLACLRAPHEALAAALKVDVQDAIDDVMHLLEQLCLGVALTGEATPRLRARVMAQGELLCTRLGAAFLSKAGVGAQWTDVRELLGAASRPNARQRDEYLNASCTSERNAAVIARLRSLPGAVLTQGFIAKNQAGETVLLGRGGSDTSAAVLAAVVGATRCEIWTDVPGVYSANPQQVPSARLLRRLDYDEAQEVATTGARVLHPRCLGPLRQAHIPLHVRCAQLPNHEGTVVGGTATDGAAVKAISTKAGVTLVSMDTLGMWQQVGFMADAFGCFKRHGVSIDLVSTSETNVTVSIDSRATGVGDDVMAPLLLDLNTICTAKTIGPCAAVSLVGRHIRGIMHLLGPALELFEEQKIHLVSQAANDLNLTFVVDEDQAGRLVRRMHALLFAERGADPLLGPSWKQTFGQDKGDSANVVDEMAPPWWHQKRQALLDIAAKGTPAFVYDEGTITQSAAALRQVSALDRVFYAMKANHHPDVVKTITNAGIGLECVSPSELDYAKSTGIDVDKTLFTPNFSPREEYAHGIESGAFLTVDNLHPLAAWPELFASARVLLRVDPGRGRGHHAHVRTAGPQSKFGVSPEQLPEARRLADQAGAHIIGLHAHAGSGIRLAESWTQTARFLVQAAELFPEVKIIDVGGGLGVRERPGQGTLDVTEMAESLAAAKKAWPRFELWMEPGRFLVASAGVLLARVTQVKQKGEVRYVGVDAGMNSLIRPALYGAWHNIVNLSRIDDAATEVVNVVGPICETGDTLGYARRLPPCQEGDVLLIATAGAYGRTMSSAYNMREPAREVWLAS